MQDGNAQKITFTFSKTGDVSLRAFVVPAEGYYAAWGPTEAPEAPAESASPSASASDEPATSASPSPSGEAESPAAGASASTSATAGQ